MEQPDFHVGIVDIKLLVFTYLCRDYALVRIFVINTFDNLPESTLINRSDNFVSVPYLFTLLYQILALLVSDGVLVLPPDVTNSIDSFKHAHFDLFKLRQLICEDIQGVLRAVSHLLVLLPEELRIERR